MITKTRTKKRITNKTKYRMFFTDKNKINYQLSV